ncbi:HAD family hydrolase [Lacisediminimonas sp.]|uniref:KdsC family phosphatase n=1 Tax=Lacisediminimonas sp. TaxID=3060582 RepID=UPI0027198D18|nr:HAD hydrolase family protein [Lacisediminimonas sp.]MDO8299900.1 HAD hydrolase family protein [Lacisediminimonas sp.]
MDSYPIASAAVLARAQAVRLMIFDVEGVLTDGSLHYGPDGEAIKTFNVLDGLGIKLLQRAGIATAIISARSSQNVARRAADLGISHLFQGVHDKAAAFGELLQQLGLGADLAGFIGDDIIDLPILRRVGFAASVPNGHIEVRNRVHYVTTAAAGNGAAREVCDLILRAQGRHEDILAAYLT